MHILEAANFSFERIAAQLMDEDANHPSLLEAAPFGKSFILKSLLAKGVDPNTRYGIKKVSVLDVAVSRGYLEIARAVLEHGVDVNGADHLGATALHTAVRHYRARADIVDLLLSAGANIDARTIEGSTPLHYALMLPDPECSVTVDILLQRGAAEGAVNAAGDSPLHLAAEYGQLRATRALLRAGADTALRAGFGKLAPLNVAAQHGQIEVIEELARHGVDVDAAPEANGFTSLHHAAWKNQAGAVDALVEAGASVTVQTVGTGSTPLHVAAEHLALEATRALLRHGAPILRACRGDGGVGLSSEPLLHIAANKAGTQGAAEVVDLLLRWGADESELDDDGKTAAEVLGYEVLEESSLAEDADRVRELLANAPADRAWRRRGLLLLCLSRDPSCTRIIRKRGGSGGEGKGAERRTEQGAEQEAEQGALAKDGDGGAGSGGSGGGGVAPSLDDYALVSAAATVEGRGKCERTPPNIGGRRVKFGGGRGGGGSRRGRGSGGDSENASGLDEVVASLLEFEEELFRTIVRFL